MAIPLSFAMVGARDNQSIYVLNAVQSYWTTRSQQLPGQLVP